MGMPVTEATAGLVMPPCWSCAAACACASAEEGRCWRAAELAVSSRSSLPRRGMPANCLQSMTCLQARNCSAAATGAALTPCIYSPSARCSACALGTKAQNHDTGGNGVG